MAVSHFRAEVLRAKAEKREIDFAAALGSFDTNAFAWGGKPKNVFVCWSYRATSSAEWSHEMTEVRFSSLLVAP